jgi:hypothetical protein
MNNRGSPGGARSSIACGSYPPRFTLEFRLTDSSGAVVKEGQRVLLDQLYLSSAALNSGDPRYYDKLLLGDWIRREFAATTQATK